MAHQPFHALCLENPEGYLEVRDGFAHLRSAEARCREENQRLEQDPTSQGRYIVLGGKIRRDLDWRAPPARPGEPSEFLHVFYNRVDGIISAVDGEAKAILLAWHILREFGQAPNILVDIKTKERIPYYHYLI